METQCRYQSVVWWIGLAAAAYEAFVAAGVAAGAALPWWAGAIGVALSAVLVYANGNNPCLKTYSAK